MERIHATSKCLSLVAILLSSLTLCGKTFTVDLRSPFGASGKRALLGTSAEDARDGVLRRVNLDAGVADVGDVEVGDELIFTLFEDVSITLKLCEQAQSPLGGDAFLAEASGYDGVKTAVVLHTVDGLTIDVQDFKNDRVYKVISSPAGVLVREIEPVRGGTCGCDALEPPPPLLVSASLQSEEETLDESTPYASISSPRLLGAVAQQSDTCVDILVAYDKNASAYADSHGGGMTNFAQVAVQKMNAALANTGLDASFRFRLVGVIAIESTHDTLNKALNAATYAEAGWEAIKAKRDEVGADVVTVLIDTGSGGDADGAAGLGWSLGKSYRNSIGSFKEMAFNACVIRAVANSHTMTHECGHNLGAGHSSEQTTQPGPQLYDYSAGYYFTGNDSKKYCTIMAYEGESVGGTRVPYFSSPDYEYMGVAVGDESHDNTLTIRNTFADAAQWRTQKVPMSYDVVFEPASGTTFDGSLAVSLAPGKEGAEIRYTTDGSDPTPSSPLYTGPIAVTERTTIKASTVIGGVCSLPYSATYYSQNDLGYALGQPDLEWTTSQFYPWVVDTERSVDGLSVRGEVGVGSNAVMSVKVTGPATMTFYRWMDTAYGYFRIMSDEDILYSTSTVGYSLGWYHQTIEVPEGEHEISFSVYCSSASGSQTSVKYWIDDLQIYYTPKPTFVPATTNVTASATVFTNEMVIAIQPPSDNCLVYYTLDGSDPNGDDAVLYDGPFFIAKSTRLKAIAVQPGRGASAVAEGQYIEKHRPCAGEWTRNGDGAFKAVKEDGRMICVMQWNYPGCIYSSLFYPIIESDEFKNWAELNGVYLVAVDYYDAYPEPGTENPSKHFSPLFRQTGLNIQYFPQLVFASAEDTSTALGGMWGYNGGSINGITYNGTIPSLIECFASVIDDAKPLSSPVASVTDAYSRKFPFDVTLSNTNGTGTIYYTLDGSAPTRENGTVYSEAITIEEPGKVLKAAVWPDDPNGVSSIPLSIKYESLTDALGMDGVTWTLGKGPAWSVLSQNPLSLRGGKNPALTSGTSTSTIKVTVNGPGVFRFTRKVASRGSVSKLEFKVGNEVVATYKSMDNGEVAYTVDEGEVANLSWVYTCDYSDNVSDIYGAWLNDVSWEPYAAPSPVTLVGNDGGYSYGALTRWDAVPGAKSYRIYRNTSNDSAGATEIGTTMQCRFWDAAAESGVRYWYWVTAVNSYGESDFSNGMQAWRDWIVEFDLGEYGERIGGGELVQGVVNGSSAVAPEVAAKDGRFFGGWDADFDNVTSNMVVSALYGDGPLAIATSSLPDAREMDAYELHLEASGGIPPYAWSPLVSSYSMSTEGSTFAETGEAQGWSDYWYSSWKYDLPFEFKFYGQSYDSVYVNGNGTLTFGGENPSGGSMNYRYFTNTVVIAPLQASYDRNTTNDVFISESEDSVTIRWIRYDSNYSSQIGGYVWTNYNFSVTLDSSGAVRFAYVTPFESQGRDFEAFFTGISAGDGLRFLNVPRSISDTHDIVFSPALEEGTQELPKGISVSSDGVVSGVPTEQGAYEIKVGVTDATRNRADKVFAFTVGRNPNGRPVIDSFVPSASASLPTGTRKKFSVAASDPEGGALTYRWELDGVMIDGADDAAFTYAPQEGSEGPHTLVCYVSDDLWKDVVSQTWKVNVTRTVRVTPTTSSSEWESMEWSPPGRILLAPGKYELSAYSMDRSTIFEGEEGASATVVEGIPSFYWDSFSFVGLTIEDSSLGSLEGTINLDGCIIRNCNLSMDEGTLRNCVVTRSRCSFYGTRIEHSTICGNENVEMHAENKWGEACASSVANTIIWDNESVDIDADVIVDYSCVNDGHVDLGVGNISADPFFVDAFGEDFRLRSGSPCIDAAQPYGDMPETDLFGNARIQDSAPDMGACEGAIEGCVIRIRTVGRGNVIYDSNFTELGGALSFSSDNSRPFSHFETNGVFATSDTTFTWRNISEDGLLTAYFDECDYYVDAVNGDDLNDGWSVATAKKTLQTAIDSCMTGDEIFVLPGIYDSISTANKAIEITAVGDLGEVVIDGGATQRCVLVGQSSNYATNTVVRGFVIRNGRATSYDDGAGALGGTLCNCVISNCVAVSGSGGGACYSRLENCLIAENSTSGRGGGAAYCYVYGCTIVKNSTSGWGGGADRCYIYNSVFWGNSGYGGEVDSARQCQHCCFGTSSDTSMNGTLIVADPLFVDFEGGDYRLADNSPCRDAGGLAHAMGRTDLDGVDRIVGDAIDMGAYEWHPDIVTVTFDPNGGDGEMLPQTLWSGLHEKLEYNSFSRSGLVFAGWSMSASGEAEYADGAAVSIDADITLYAKWATGVEITYDANGGSGRMPRQSFVGGEAHQLAANTFRKEGHYRFAGWATSADGEIVYENCEIVSPDANMTLYAVWTSDMIWTVVNGVLTSVDMNGVVDAYIPEGVTSIGPRAFYQLSDLSKVVFPTSVTNISDYAFCGCSSLSTVRVPGSVARIGNYAFSECIGLMEVFMDEGVVSLGNSVFSECINLENVHLPSTALTFGIRVFLNCKALKGINLPDELDSLPSSLLYNCYAIKELKIPTRTLNICDWAVFYCKGLEEVTIPDSVATIGLQAFCGCSGLRNIYLSDGLKDIGKQAFQSCSSLETVIIPQTITNIGAYAFAYCDNLRNVYVPSGVELDDTVFANSANVQVIRYAENDMVSIALKANGGHGSMSNKITLRGVAAKLPLNEFSRDGKTFLGWSTAPDGQREYEDGATIVADDDMELYAVWGENIAISFDSNGGYGLMPSQVSVSGVAKDLPACTLVKPDYVFQGWALNKDGQVVYLDGASATFEADVTLFAIWEKPPFTFDGYAPWVKDVGGTWRSGSINDDEYSSAIMSVNGAGTLAFDWKTSCEDYDTLEFYIDGKMKTSISGASGTWSSKNFKVEESGNHLFEWRYVKDESDREGQDCGWIRNVVWTPEGGGVTIEGDGGAVVSGDAQNGWTVTPSPGVENVVVSVPHGVDASKVVVEVSADVKTVKSNGARVRVVKLGNDITEFLDLDAATQGGVLNISAAKVKQEIADAIFQADEAVVELSAETARIVTGPTKPGLTYTFREGSSIDGMVDKQTKTGDGKPFEPEISVKPANSSSAFYSIMIDK